MNGEALYIQSVAPICRSIAHQIFREALGGTRNFFN